MTDKTLFMHWLRTIYTKRISSYTDARCIIMILFLVVLLCDQTLTLASHYTEAYREAGNIFHNEVHIT